MQSATTLDEYLRARSGCANDGFPLRSGSEKTNKSLPSTQRDSELPSTRSDGGDGDNIDEGGGEFAENRTCSPFSELSASADDEDRHDTEADDDGVEITTDGIGSN